MLPKGAAFLPLRFIKRKLIRIIHIVYEGFFFRIEASMDNQINQIIYFRQKANKLIRFLSKQL